MRTETLLLMVRAVALAHGGGTLHRPDLKPAGTGACTREGGVGRCARPVEGRTRARVVDQVADAYSSPYSFHGTIFRSFRSFEMVSLNAAILSVPLSTQARATCRSRARSEVMREDRLAKVPATAAMGGTHS